MMGFLDKLKDAFSGQPEDSGIYVYVRLDRTGEIVRLRLEPQYELAPNYSEGGYKSHKSIVGPETLARADAVFLFDEQRRLIDAEINGGELADEHAWQAQHTDQNTDSAPDT